MPSPARAADGTGDLHGDCATVIFFSTVSLSRVERPLRRLLSVFVFRRWNLWTSVVELLSTDGRDDVRTCVYTQADCEWTFRVLARLFISPRLGAPGGGEGKSFARARRRRTVGNDPTPPSVSSRRTLPLSRRTTGGEVVPNERPRHTRTPRIADAPADRLRRTCRRRRRRKDRRSSRQTADHARGSVSYFGHQLHRFWHFGFPHKRRAR